MKATLFSRVPYMGSAPGGVWPVPPAASCTAGNRAVGEAVASSGSSGRDAATQRARTQVRDLKARIVGLFGTKVLPRVHEL
jgi:hypothetical protein